MFYGDYFLSNRRYRWDEKIRGYLDFKNIENLILRKKETLFGRGTRVSEILIFQNDF